MTVMADPRPRLDLSGAWQLAFDPGDEGIRARWMAGRWPEARSQWVQVPALWDVTHPDAEGVGFYRRAFTLPADWHSDLVLLHFGGVSYRCEVWLNGRYAGSHEGAYTPFSLDVTSLVRPGSENELVVRVAALSTARDVDGMPLLQSPASKQSWYYTHGGLWGQVYLEGLPGLACRSLAVEPDLEREMVLVEVGVGNSLPESHRLDLRLQVTRPDGTLAAEERSSVTVPPGRPCLSYRIPLPRPVLWDCQNPHLYRLQVGIGEGGEPCDVQAVRFGMREFTVRDGQFILNGEPIYLRGLLLQPHYPVTLVTPPTREMMVREITLAREAGFNLIRLHIRPAPPGYLDLTDEMGMLVYAESCLAWIRDSPRLLDHARRELQAMIDRDRNHPSVVFWGIYNENRSASALTSEPLIRFVRALDPTRVVVDNSGGTMAIDQDFGWADRTTVVPSRRTEREAIQDLHIYVGAPIPPAAYEWLRTLGTPDGPVDMAALDFGSPATLETWNRELRTYRGQVFVSELGCGGMADLDAVVAAYGDQQELRDAREMRAFRDSLHQGFAARGLDSIFGSVRGLVEASQEVQAQGLTRQVEALLANRRVSGYVVTQLNDVAWEFHAGVLDPWRHPKPVYHALKRLQAPHVVILKADRPAMACRERAGVAVTLVSREPLEGGYQVEITTQGPSGEPLEARAVPAPRGAGVWELGTVPVEAGPQPGQARVVARLVRHARALAEASEAILVLPPVNLETAAAGVRSLGAAPAGLAGRQDGPVWLAARPASLAGRDWQTLLDAVAAGGTGIIGPLHGRDRQALAALADRGLIVELHYGIGSWMGCYHWQPRSQLFAGLPAGGLAGEAYVEVLPWYVMSELGGQVLAGSLRNTQTRREPPAILWYSDVEAVPFDRGRLLFCQYRIFEQAATNPLAARLVANLIDLAHGHDPASGAP